MPKSRGTELWKSLNFVTLGQVKRAFAQRGLQCNFAKGTMHKAFVRLDADEKYRERQGGHYVVSIANGLLRRLGLLQFVAALPPFLATPMTFEVRRPSEESR
jgi:hypothetical protein